jgi:CheY-like chemotaxis protein
MENGQGIVLLVEDNTQDVFLIQRAFRKASLNTRLHVVCDGEQAMTYLMGEGNYADRHHYPLPTVVLLDLKMPRKSGFEVLAWLRQQPGLKRLPVVVLTSSGEAADVNRAYELGANSYLVKPVAFNALLEIVKTVDLYWVSLNQRPECTTII